MVPNLTFSDPAIVRSRFAGERQVLTSRSLLGPTDANGGRDRCARVFAIVLKSISLQGRTRFVQALLATICISKEKKVNQVCTSPLLEDCRKQSQARALLRPSSRLSSNRHDTDSGKMNVQSRASLEAVQAKCVPQFLFSVASKGSGYC